MRILLVRHGESMGNIDPTLHDRMADHAIPLSPHGHEQARVCGERLRAFYLALPERDRPAPDKVRLWTSPYRRTRETADGIEHGAGALIGSRREHILLCEQQFGLFDGIPDEDLPRRFPAESAHYRKQEEFEGRFWARMPLGESRFDVATRIHQAFGTFHRDKDSSGIRDIIVVCHGVTLRAFVMMWLHLPPEWFEHERNPANCSIRLLDEGVDKGYLA
jgi:2,3-bisphosphoglycerate-dependent phosphoglycerate mutase